MKRDSHSRNKSLRPAVIGMVHLRPLPDSPRWAGDMDAVAQAALIDARSLATGGVDAIMIENYGDTPFYPGAVPPATIAAMTSVIGEIRALLPNMPLGVNVLRNDGLAALAIAAAVNAQFIRVNVLCGARLGDQGILQGIAHDLLRLRARLGAESIRILADVNVKHSAPLAATRLEDEVADLLERGGADAVIVTGAATGQTTPIQELRAVKAAAAGRAPVLVGSGIDADSIADYLPLADGFIVGTWLKRGGKVSAPVDPARVRRLMQAIG